MIFPLPGLDSYAAHRSTLGPCSYLTTSQILIAEAKKKENSNSKRGPRSCAAHHPPLFLLDCAEQRRKAERIDARKSTSPSTSHPRSLAFLSSLHSPNNQCSPCQPYTAFSSPPPCSLPLLLPLREHSPVCSLHLSLTFPHPTFPTSLPN